MNEEIKAILIQNGEPTPENPIEIKRLLVNKEAEDYITNLQEELERYQHYSKTTGIEELMAENERLKKSNENASKVCLAEHRYGVDKAEEARDYKSRNEKANWWLKEMLKQAKSDETKAIINGTLELLLNGGDEK